MGPSRGEHHDNNAVRVAAVEALRAVGVTTIFGLMGSSTLELYDTLYDATDVTYIGVRHCWPKRVSRRCQL